MKKHRSEGLFRQRKSLLNKFCNFRIGEYCGEKLPGHGHLVGQLRAKMVTRRHVEAYLDHQRTTPSKKTGQPLGDKTLRHIVIALKATWNWAADEQEDGGGGMLASGHRPLRKLPRGFVKPKDLSESDLPTDQEIEILHRWAPVDPTKMPAGPGKWRKRLPDEYYTADSRVFADMLRTYHSTGARTSELCLAQVRDFMPRTRHTGEELMKMQVCVRSTARNGCFYLIAIGCFHLVACQNLRASEFLGLGDLPGGIVRSNASGVDENGTIVVGSSSTDVSSTDNSSAFAWNDSAGITNIVNPVFSVGRVSADGMTAVGGFRNGSDVEPFRWTASGGLVPLGLPAGEPPNGASFATDVSGDGGVIVGATVFAGEGQAFRWTSTDGFTNLVDDLPGDVLVSQAVAVSNDGDSIAGDFTTSDGVQRAFYWTTTGGGADLGDLPGGSVEAQVFDVSADGDWVVGTSHSSTSDTDGFLWSPVTGMTRIAAPGATQTVPFAVAGLGKAVVGESVDLGVSSDAFVWTEARGVEHLQGVLTNRFGLGPQLSGWTLTSANDISSDGRFLVGEGINPDGNQEAWLVRLDQPIFVPEPTGIILSLAALSALSLPRRKHYDS